MEFFNKIMDWIYSNKGYYTLKSGLFTDHFFKKLFSKISKQLNVYLGVLFLEKHVIENYTKKITESLFFSSNLFLNLKKKNNMFTLNFMLFAVVILFLITFSLYFYV